MNRRDFFGAAMTQMITATSSRAGCGDHIETFINNKLQSYLSQVQRLEINMRKIFGELKGDATNCNNQVAVLSESVVALAERLKRIEHRQILIFFWLLTLTFLSGVDMFQLTIFFPVSYDA